MRTAIQIGISYEQVRSLVMQLPQEEKAKLSIELEKEGIQSRLSNILSAFKTDELSMEEITADVEAARQAYHARQKH